MKLELDIFNIKDIQFGGQTTIRDKVLYIDRHELKNLLQQDRRLGKVDIELAHPGESCGYYRLLTSLSHGLKPGGPAKTFQVPWVK